MPHRSTPPEWQSLVVPPSDSGQTNGDGDEREGLQGRVAAAEARVTELERDLHDAIDDEAALARQLDTQRSHRTSLEQQLFEAREQTSLLRLDEATRARDEALAAAADEAARMTREAFGQAQQELAEARQESAAIVDAGRAQLETLEAEANQRISDLTLRYKKMANRLDVMQRLYDDLQATLRLVAETSVDQLADAQRSLPDLEPETDGPATATDDLPADSQPAIESPPAQEIPYPAKDRRAHDVSAISTSDAEPGSPPTDHSGNAGA